MSETTKHWEGQIVEGIFPLRKYLGGSDHSAVFLTEYAEAEGQRAAIKLVNADRAMADLQLTNWRFAAQLAHPNLLRLYRTGRCRIEGNDLLYLVMEYADEDLADVLPGRALSPEEARDMLNPVLDALEYLHSKGFVHGDLKPANILATQDQLKLSSDAISRADETQTSPRKSSVYDPPEAVNGMKTEAGDVWALGTTLVEVLTQKVPDWQPGPNREPLVPETIPAPFGEIARQCLRLEPNKRVSVAQIAERLNVRAAVASASAAIAGVSANPMPAAAIAAPVAAPTAAPAIPAVAAQKPAAASSSPAVPRPAPRPSAMSVGPQAYVEARKKKPKYLVPLIVGAFAFALIVTIPGLLTRRPQGPSAPATGGAASVPAEPVAAKPVAAVEPSKPKPDRKAPSRETAEQVAPVPATTAAANPTTTASSETLKSASDAEQPVPAANSAPPPPARATAGGVGSPKGEVLDQVLPDVADKARSTIRGRVRVGVKVHVDAAGAVSDAELDSPGPSQFFADLALKAARRWVFTPPEVDGKSVPSEWVLHFVFTQGDTKVTPAQTVP